MTIVELVIARTFIIFIYFSKPLFVYLTNRVINFPYSFILLIIPVGKEFIFCSTLQFKFQTLLKSGESVVGVDKLNLPIHYFSYLKENLISSLIINSMQF